MTTESNEPPRPLPLEAVASKQKEREAALDYCRGHIHTYESSSNHLYLKYVLLQSSAVLFSSLTPVLILVTELPEAVQALPAVLGAAAAGLTAIWYSPADKTRYTISAELLKGEHIAFLSASGPYRDLREEEATGLFVEKCRKIVLKEVSQWKAPGSPGVD